MTTLAQVTTSQINKETTINECFTAVSPSGMFGRKASTTAGLTWGYYGGIFPGTYAAIADGTLTLAASNTNYIEVDSGTGVVSSNTSGFSGGSKRRLYSAVTNGSGITSFTDYRTTLDFAAAQLAGNNVWTGTNVWTGGAAPGVSTSEISIGVYAGASRLDQVDSTRTANNRIHDISWGGGSIGFGFVNDAFNATTTWLSATGGQASGITGITSNSGSGSWAHTGAMSVTSNAAPSFQVSGTGTTFFRNDSAVGTTNNLTQTITTADGGKGMYHGIDITNRRFYWRMNDSADYTFAWQNTAGTNLMALSPTGNLTVSGTGPHAIGTVTGTRVGLTLNLNATATSAAVGLLTLGGGMTAAANNDFMAAFGSWQNGTNFARGTFTGLDASGIRLDPAAEWTTNGTGTIATATTIKIVSAPTIGTTNRALWVLAGLVQFDGNLKVGSTGSGASLGGSGCIDLTADIGITSTNGIIVSSTRVLAFTSSDRVLTVNSSSGNSLVKHSSGGTAKYSTGYNNPSSDAYIIYDEAHSQYVAQFFGVASAVNYFQFTNSTSGNEVTFGVAGGNIPIAFGTHAKIHRGSSAAIVFSVEGYPSSLPTMKLNRDNTDNQAALWLHHDRADAATQATAIYFENQLNANVGNLTMGAGNAVALTSTSDARLKNDHGPASMIEAASRLRRYAIREYSWKDDPTSQHRIGGFAQQIYEVNRAIAQKGGADPKREPWTIDKAEYVNDLVLGWQEHDDELGRLRNRVATLEAELESRGWRKAA